MRVPPPFLSYDHLKMAIFAEQQVVNDGKYSGQVGRCVWCGELGGIGQVYTRPWPGRPITPFAEPHHWFLKRGTGLPDEILNNPENVVLLHRHCHMVFGQRKEMTERCMAWKASLTVGLGSEKRPKYNIDEWVAYVDKML